MPDVPLILLCSMGIDAFKTAVSQGVSESLLREEIEGKRRLYTALAESVPRGEVRPIDAGHVTMHLRRPGGRPPGDPGPSWPLVTQATSGARHNRTIGMPPTSRTIAAMTNTYSIWRHAEQNVASRLVINPGRERVRN